MYLMHLQITQEGSGNASAVEGEMPPKAEDTGPYPPVLVLAQHRPLRGSRARWSVEYTAVGGCASP